MGRNLSHAEWDGMKGIFMNQFFNLPIGIPPFSEQARIAQRINAMRGLATFLHIL